MAAAAGAFTNTVFGLIRAYITVAAIGAAGGTLAGYSAAEGITYAFLAQALMGPVNIGVWQGELAERVKTGDIAVDLARPVDPQLAYFAADLGRAAFAFLPRGAPPLLVGAVVFGLALPGTPLPYVLGAASVLLAVSVSFACRWLAHLAAFWLLDVRGVMMLYVVASGLLSGHLIPVHWFPGWLASLAHATPFPAMIQTPIDVVTGRAAGLDALTALGVQAVWLVATLTLGHWVFARGTRKLVAQGG